MHPRTTPRSWPGSYAEVAPARRRPRPRAPLPRIIALPLALAVLTPLALTINPALAGDAVRDRTPVIHLGESCMTVVDREATPIVRLDLTFPFEDTCAGLHDPPSFQFFALCRPLAPHEHLPQWITRADIDHAIALGFALPTLGPEDVLEESPTWSGCWARITADDGRRPLTCTSALSGVLWDISAAPLGVQVVAAYTFQPPLNLWSPRWGVFAITEGDAAAAPPVAAIANRAAFVYADEVMDLEACAHALPGSTLRFEYAIDTATPIWVSAVELLAVAGSAVIAPWDPPASVEAEGVRLRAVITDPLGRTGIVESPELQAMLAVPSPTSGDVDPPTPAPDTCRDVPTPAQVVCPMSGATTGTTTTATATGDDPPEDSESGCACAAAPTGGAPTLLAFALVALFAPRPARWRTTYR